MKTFYVTTPIYYVNDVPHIGHAYTTIAADILARFHRQMGEDVFFLTGTDEHGNPAARAAGRRGLTPQQHVDEMVGKFQALAARVNASNDFFIRTTDREHGIEVQRFIQKLYEKGEIYLKSYRGLYCSACEAFFAEKDLVDGKCPDHGIPVEVMEEENYFFALSNYQRALLEYYDRHPDFVRPASRRNEARSFIEQGLEDISISRASLEWGIPVPWDESQVVYVWVDALLNYLSALKFARPGEDLSGRFWPADYHLMAKDILKFHAVIWPALLLAAGYELPRHLFVHGYLLLGGQKMSKTRGNVLDPFEVMDRYGVDSFRFYCFREVAFGQDGTISMEGFESRYNAELANELGNLLSRTVAMIRKYSGSNVPAPEAAGSALAQTAIRLRGQVVEAMEDAELTAALEKIWLFVRSLNKYIEDTAPWKMARDQGLHADLDAVLGNLAEGLRLTAVLLHPFMPASTAEIMRQLGQPAGAGDFILERAGWGEGKAGVQVEPGKALFPKLQE